MSPNGQTDWQIKGEEAMSCNCAWGCPCQFEANPTHGHCRAGGALMIHEGHFGDTSLDGVRWGMFASWPGPIPEGNGTMQIVVDENASEEQREAIVALTSGQHGGTFFEIFAAVCPDLRDPITAPIQVEADRERRVASVRIGDFFESRVEPIKSPVDGSEHRARIDLPEGFEYKIAEVGNTVTAKSSLEQPLDLDLENTYAQLAEIDWSPS